MALLFESETCSRCGGSGHYSYCQRYGTVCFRCQGNKQTLTKRGTAAQAYYIGLLSLPVSQLVPGMKIRDIGMTNGGDIFNQWLTVERIEADTTEYNGQVLLHYRVIIATTKQGETHNIAVPVTNVFRVAAPMAVKLEKLHLSIQYQRSLNTSGKADKTLAKLMKTVAYA